MDSDHGLFLIHIRKGCNNGKKMQKAKSLYIRKYPHPHMAGCGVCTARRWSTGLGISSFFSFLSIYCCYQCTRYADIDFLSVLGKRRYICAPVPVDLLNELYSLLVATGFETPCTTSTACPYGASLASFPPISRQWYGSIQYDTDGGTVISFHRRHITLFPSPRCLLWWIFVGIFVRFSSVLQGALQLCVSS